VRTRSLLLTAFLTLVGLLLGSPTAHAAEATVPIVTYEGTITMAFSDGTFDVTARLTVDCSTKPCTALATILGGDLVASPTNDTAVPLVDGAASVALPEYGDLCDLRWIGAGQLDIAAGSTSATITRSSAPGGPVGCSDGSEATATEATVSGTLSYQTGSVCVIDSSCPTATPRPTATASPKPIAAEKTIAELIVWPTDPSILSTLRTPSEAFSLPGVAWAVGGATVLGLLVGLPSVLLDSATERISAWFEERRMRRGREPRPTWAAPPLTLLGWPLAALGLIVAGIASALVDPDFGLTWDGARSAASIVGAFLAVIAVSWGCVGLIMKLAGPHTLPRVEFRPLTLVVVAAAVVFSRLSGLEPGVIFGLVAGLGFGAVVGARARGVVALLSVLYLLAASTLGWLGYGYLSARLGNTPEWWQLLGVETLAAIAMTGVSALPVALLPVRGLLGHSLWGWSRVLWGFAYGASIAGFLFMLLPLPDSWESVGVPVQVWVIGFGSYALLAVLVWLAVVRPWSRAGRDTNSS
jgi:hypothetical protein